MIQRAGILALAALLLLAGCEGLPAPVGAPATTAPPGLTPAPAAATSSPTLLLPTRAPTPSPTLTPPTPAPTLSPTLPPPTLAPTPSPTLPRPTLAPTPSPTPPPSATPAPTATSDAPDPAPTPAGSPAAHHYTVQRGDTLWQIARRFGLPVEVLAAANGFDGRKVLREGMSLMIPWSNAAGTARYGADGPVVTGPGLHFVASIAQQACWLFRDGAVEASWPCSTGRPGSPSIPGNYTVKTKAPRAYNAAADFWMPHWLGVYDAGIYENGIHGVPYSAETGETRWQDLVGTPITYGCIMLDDATAEALYHLAYLGMPVTILP